MYVVFPFPIFLSLFDRLGHGSSHHDMGLNKVHGDGWGEGRGQGAGLMGEEGAALEVVGSHVGKGAAAGDQPGHRGLGGVARASSRGG